jgi:hypothetical protein
MRSARARTTHSVIRGLDPRIHHSSQRLLRRRWMAGSSPAMTSLRVPDAVQCRLTVHRRAGTVTNTALCTAPVLQRTAAQELRAALRPGQASSDDDLCTIAFDAPLSI